MNHSRFLKSIWAVQREGSWLFLAARKGGRWIECPIRNDGQLDQNIRTFIREHPKREWDLYFCPNAFTSPNRKAPHALQTPYAWCDIDDANPAEFVPPPGALWLSSPGRYQGLWHFTRALSPARAEDISRYLTYEHGGDPNGWSVTKVLRIPGTYNHKRVGKPPKVKLLEFDLEPIRPGKLLKSAPKRRIAANPERDLSFNIKQDPKTLYKRYRRQIKHIKASALLRHPRVMLPDRSAQIFTMMKGLFEAEVPWNDIACLIWHSPYFQSKHGSDCNALKAEILRAMNKFDKGM